MAKTTEYALQIAIGGKIASSLKKAVGGSTKELSKMRKIAAAGFAATATAAVAVTKELYNIGAAFDDAYDQIRIGTGATGEQLQELQQSMNNVYAAVPADMEATATAISDYNTRLDLTGETLETLSTQALQASDMLGEDLSGMIEASSQAMNQWNISEQDMSGNMDYMFKVSQSTGKSMTELFAGMKNYGPQLQELGYDFQNGAALIGQLEKAGVNTTEVLSAMKRSVGSLAKEGISAPEGFENYVKQIENAGTITEATAIAIKAFGARAGSSMAAAIRDGTLSVEDFTAALEANQETIASTAFDTYDFPEQLEIMKHQLEVALQPAASEIFGVLSDMMPILSSLLDSTMPMITETLTIISPLLDEIFSGLLPELTPVVQTLIEMLFPVMMSIADIFPSIIEAVSTVISILPIILPELQPIFEIITLFLPLIGSVLNVITALQPVIILLAERISTVLSESFEFIMPIVENSIGIFQGLIDFITNVFQGNWAGAWEAIKNVVFSAWNTIKSVFYGGVNHTIKMLNAIIGAINKVHIGPLPNWKILGEYAGMEIGFHVPTIPQVAFAEGGIVTRPTQALIGEGSEPEGVFPLSKLEDFLSRKDEKTEPITFVFSPVINYTGESKEEIKGIFDEEFERFKIMMKQYERDKQRVTFA